MTVAVLELEGLDAITRSQGCAAGDQGLLIAARAAQLAAARAGTSVCRDSGRRLVVLARRTPTSPPSCTPSSSSARACASASPAGEWVRTGEDVIARARRHGRARAPGQDGSILGCATLARP